MPEQMNAATLAAWLPADAPPEGLRGCWSAPVVVVTNLGNVYQLAYFNGDDSGVWQRPKAFVDGEQVKCWRPMPEFE